MPVSNHLGLPGLVYTF